jgi:co-chaperonin GroES (HSP10)
MVDHEGGRGSKYVRSYRPFELIYVESADGRSGASKREAEIKKMSKEEKKYLVKESKMSFPIEPLFDRVFVKKDEAKKTESGLHLPETVKGRAVTGIVVAVGPGQRNHLGKFLPTCVKTGDRVFLKEFSGYIIKYKDEEEIFVFNENELIGVMKGEQNK